MSAKFVVQTMSRKATDMTRDEAIALVAKDEANRLKKNEALRKWRTEHKSEYNEYIKQWRAKRKQMVEEAKALLSSEK